MSSALATKDVNASTGVKQIPATTFHAEQMRQHAARSPVSNSPASMPSTPIIISIEAAIGTGKSSLLRLLQSKVGDNWIVVQEPVEEWQKIGGKHNLLEAYYGNQERFAFSFQANCVLSRIRGLQEVLETQVTPSTQVIILERCWHSDRNTFAEMLKARDKISEMEWCLYDNWYQFAVRAAPFIDGHVYLDAKAETCMTRLRRRDRSEEVGVTSEYQQELIKRHEDWLETLPDPDRICRVAVDQDFINDPANSAQMVGTIRNFVDSLVAKRNALMTPSE